MFTDKLFDHKYDIDDVLRAFCGADHSGRWLLCTRDGRVIAEAPQGAPTTTVADGDDANHWHVIDPLPASYLAELRIHERKRHLSADEQADLATRLAPLQSCAALPALFDQGRVGGWLRERVKESALEWLDLRGLIPPSMRHVRPATIDKPTPTPRTVRID